nr:unnamed protein product [Callosobruchus analis]
MQLIASATFTPTTTLPITNSNPPVDRKMKGLHQWVGGQEVPRPLPIPIPRAMLAKRSTEETEPPSLPTSCTN